MRLHRYFTATVNPMVGRGGDDGIAPCSASHTCPLLPRLQEELPPPNIDDTIQFAHEMLRCRLQRLLPILGVNF
jgi:hypothetical protein